MDPAFKKGKTLAFLRQAGIDAGRIVIEITEQQPTDNFPLMRDAVSHYRGMGFEIALDDLGAGYSGLRLWTELLPDYVKIDRHFIQDIDKDAVKLKFVRSLQSMAAATHCRVIAEGVETAGEYHVVQALGLDLAQGYYFARPSAQAVTEISASLFNEKRQSNPYLINRCPSVRKNIDQNSRQDPEQGPLKVAG
nr:EAL domain-containing protein [Methylomarinum sp. Ch1-1]MDP4522233.1 EAL domain-containing protein [Methylomarinum sp. Ch1-1]